MIYYVNWNPLASSPELSELLTTISCVGFSGTNTNQFIMCAISGTPSNQVLYAFNSNGDSIPFYIRSAYGSGGTSITNTNGIATGNLGISSSGGVANNSTFVRAPLVELSWQNRLLPAGDYVATVPLTVDIRTANQSGAMSSCSSGTSAGVVTLSLPITIRIDGAACAINNVESVSFGDISVNNTGRVSAQTITSTIEIACARGTSWTITFSDGNNPSGTGAYRRRMVNGSSFLTYGFGTSSSSARTSMSLSGTTSQASANNGSQQLTYYAFLPQQFPASLTQGLYRDTVIMTVTY
jgi:spore coat protein U-like protein